MSHIMALPMPSTVRFAEMKARWQSPPPPQLK